MAKRGSVVPKIVWEIVTCIGYRDRNGKPHTFRRKAQDKNRRICNKCRKKQEKIISGVSPQMLEVVQDIRYMR